MICDSSYRLLGVLPLSDPVALFVACVVRFYLPFRAVVSVATE